MTITAILLRFGPPTLSVVAAYVVRAMAAALLLFSLFRIYLHLTRKAVVAADIASPTQVAGGVA